MHVDVELRGEFTRAETVANRQNALNRKVPRGDRLVFEGTEPLQPNTHVAAKRLPTGDSGSAR